MSEQTGEKTEHATPKHLEEALKKGQFARSAEIQTVAALLAGLCALQFAGGDLWRRLTEVQVSILGHLHDIPISPATLHGYAMVGALTLASCVGPFVLATMAAGLLAGATQSRFRTASEALSFNWERLSPVNGFKQIFGTQATVTTTVAMLKLSLILTLSWARIKGVLADPIFYQGVSTARIAEFMAKAAFTLWLQLTFALSVVAAIDYGYQIWKTSKDLMMTKQEVKEELKTSEANPQMKARRRRRRNVKTMRRMLMDVPKADVIVTNPTHIAVALRYDRNAMKAPMILAKGTRLNAQRIREIAARHQIPIIENKPLARLMFKYGRVGGEIPAQLYAAVAEILAWVYRVNRYHYYARENQA
jgi:flagellar biosynthetic protein FlhB